MSEWIGETFTSDAGWSHLETLVDVGNRMAGSEGDLDTRVHFACYGTEEVGLVGSEHHAERVDFARDDVTVPRKEPEKVAGMLEAEDLAEGMKPIGDWPYQ